MKTSAVTLGRWDVTAVMAFYGLYLIVWSAVVAPVLASGWWWVGVAIATAQAAWHFQLIRQRSRDGCFKAFRLNHWVGLAVFSGIFASLL
jgi:4-hydroxybenzoate polyprenyltransferase